ncbi:MAG: S-layer homology domain-containing protein [Microcoleus vaginatus WJT46-NPBG5]|jgi:hypothetical protein|nr:S-layer homology domain-containing protein [Microcoleus vaginatus WJT46-NPBG5]
MLNFFKNLHHPATVILGMTLIVAPAAIAQQPQQIEQAAPQKSMTYGCFAGYPDDTFRGDQPVSRYEFAAGMSACLDQIRQLIESSRSEGVTKEDLAAPAAQLERSREELDNLRERLDNLDPESK